MCSNASCAQAESIATGCRVCVCVCQSASKPKMINLQSPDGKKHFPPFHPKTGAENGEAIQQCAN